MTELRNDSRQIEVDNRQANANDRQLSTDNRQITSNNRHYNTDHNSGHSMKNGQTRISNRQVDHRQIQYGRHSEYNRQAATFTIVLLQSSLC